MAFMRQALEQKRALRGARKVLPHWWQVRSRPRTAGAGAMVSVVMGLSHGGAWVPHRDPCNARGAERLPHTAAALGLSVALGAVEEVMTPEPAQERDCAVPAFQRDGPDSSRERETAGGQSYSLHRHARLRASSRRWPSCMRSGFVMPPRWRDSSCKSAWLVMPHRRRSAFLQEGNLSDAKRSESCPRICSRKDLRGILRKVVPTTPSLLIYLSRSALRDALSAVPRYIPKEY